MGTKVVRDGSIYIMCEGEKTENYFLRDLFDGLSEVGKCRIEKPEIYPFPEEENEKPPLQTSRKRGGRKMHEPNKPTKQAPKITGQPPLNWVNAALKALESHSEAWVVFDNDNHPALEEAFSIVREARANKIKLNVAYSSRCFEYYMLLHHEYIEHRFAHVECKENHDTYSNCCHPTKEHLSNACDGILTEADEKTCINGYARNKGYWVDSKCSGVFQNLPNIWEGVNNASKLKWFSIARDNSTALHLRNPYLNTYRIVLRFMGYKELSPCEPVILDRNNEITISLEDGELVINNPNQKTTIISADRMGVYNIDRSTKFGIIHIGNLSRVQSEDSKITIDTSILKENPDSLLIMQSGADSYFMSSGALSVPNMNEIEFSAFDLTSL